jgi:hypothetical protein
MKKVRLELDQLAVETFTAGLGEPVDGGTVEARVTGNTCAATCYSTCPNTCSHELPCRNTG